MTTTIPFAEFATNNRCMMMPDGCEDITWIRERFGDPVEITQEFIRQAYLRYRGVGVCALLEQYIPEQLRKDHAAFVKAAKAAYRDAIRRAENTLAKTGDVAAYDQAVSIAFLLHRGQRFGALEGAFTPRFDPYF